VLRIHLSSKGLVSALAVIVSAAAATGATADAIDVDLTEPTLDRWFYPFNSNPGFKTEASIFGSATDLEIGFDPAFDNRDGQMLVGFDTSGVVPTGLGPEAYTISQASLLVTVKSDLTF